MSLTMSTDGEVMGWLGQHLASLREEQRLTRLEVAARAGLSRRTVYRAEHGQNPTLLTVVRLLRLFGRLEALGDLLPEAEVSPMALVRAERARGRRERSDDGRGDE